MEELLIEQSLYNPEQLQPIIDNLTYLLQEIVKSKVYIEWLLGLSIAIFATLLVIVFAIFFTNYK